MTLPSFIGVGTAQWIASNGAAIPSMSPANGATGDLLLLILERNDTTVAPAVTNWTNIAGATGTNSTTQSSAVYWKVATSATGTSDATGAVTWATGTTVRGGVVLRFSNCSAVAPIHNQTLANVASTATTVNATNLTTTVNNCIAVFIASMIGARSTTNTTTNWTAGTGVTAFASQQTSLGNDLTIGYGEKTFATAGSLLTPGIVWTTNTTTGVGQGILLALREVFTPNAPTSSAATSVRGLSFTANWSAPSTDSTHDAATGYQVDVATDAGFSSLIVGFNSLDVGNVTSKSVTGLTAGTAYWYRVRAYNNAATPASGNSGSQTLTTAGSDVYGGAVLAAAGLVGYWRLNESSGQALDTNSTFDATSTSATQAATGLLAGTSDTAYSFNGTTNRVSVPFASALNPAAFSLEVWIKATDTTALAYAANMAENAGVGASIGVVSGQFNVSTGKSGIFIGAANTGTIYHLVFTHTGSLRLLYVNGVQIVAVPDQADTYTAATSLAFAIGSSATGAQLFSGTIDEVALYNVVLTQATISDHYNKGLAYFAEISGSPDGHRGQVQMHQLLSQ